MLEKGKKMMGVVCRKVIQCKENIYMYLKIINMHD